MKTKFVQQLVLFTAMALCTFCGQPSLSGAVIPVTDAKVQEGLSPYNWVCKDDSISSSICGASLAVGFQGTKRVVLQVDTAMFKTPVASRYPILAWSVNGGALQTHQLAANEKSFALVTGVQDPVIDLYIKGMSPFENRWSGDIPQNSVKITGFSVDEGAATRPVALAARIWLSIGDSIMSGDGAAYALDQGRPPNDLWAASDDARASYGYLLARHYRYREARIAYGGYNWRGGGAGIPALATLIDQRTETVSRLSGGILNPPPAVALINLGENGVPADEHVARALEKLRSRVGKATKVIVMIPVSGRGREAVTCAFNHYKSSAKDDSAYLVDLGQIQFDTADGQHPTAKGHQEIYQATLPAFDAILAGP